MQEEQMQLRMQNEQASGLMARKAIGEEQARKAMDTLQKYRQGKSALEARVIASEDYLSRDLHFEMPGYNYPVSIFPADTVSATDLS